jgi:hypothetical protein
MFFKYPLAKGKRAFGIFFIHLLHLPRHAKGVADVKQESRGNFVSFGGGV